MAYQTAANTGIVAPPGGPGPISVGPITPYTANSYAVVACQYFSNIIPYDGWSQPGGASDILVQQFPGQPSITNTATVNYLDGLNDEWAAVMAVYATTGTPVMSLLTGGSFSAFHYPSADPHIVAVNQDDSILVWVGVGTFIPGGQNGGDPNITVMDSDNNQYTFVKSVSILPHINTAYLFTAFKVNANASLTVTITGASPSGGPTGWFISTVTHLTSLVGFSFGSYML